MRVNYALIILSLFIGGVANAVPVVDITQDQQQQQSQVQQQPLVQPSAVSNQDQVSQQSVDTSDMSVEQRLTRLEKLVSAQGQIQLLNQINQMQQQVEILQGQNEVLRHRLQQLKTQQQTLYTDLNQRVSALENGKPLKRTKPRVNFADFNTMDDQNAYQRAYNLIATREYTQAIAALSAFVKQYPKSSYVPNAIYWQAEVLAAQDENTQAVKLFQQLVSKYPNSAKIPDAQLKLAMIAAANHQTVQAEQQLQNIVKQYPNSAAASLAATQLRQLKKDQ